MDTIVGIDVGYGYTKAVSNQRQATMRSVIGPALQIKYHNDLISNGQGLEVQLGDKVWFLGELARLQSPFTISPRARERDAEVVRPLLLGALYQLGLSGGGVRLVTGLPVSWYPDRAALVQSLLGPHNPVINGNACRFEIVDVLVVPQPFGSFFRVLLSTQGVLEDREELSRERVALLDIGTHTTDYALADGLRYVEPKSGSIPVAMARVYELVRRDINDGHRLEMSLQDVEDAVQRGSIRLYGQRHPIDDLVQRALDAVGQEILGEALTLWGDGREFAAILVTGGGGVAFLDRIQAVYPHARLVPDAQLANAEGFYRYALRKFTAVGAMV